MSQNCLLWKRHCRDTVLSPLNVGVPTDHGFLNIYGLSNRFYCSCTLVGVLTIPRFLGQVLNKSEFVSFLFSRIFMAS
ncbi:hypothetical protein LEP1GSC133_5120 [Leptospira borgpetersenii serovar Pomona str. 200901868]|uniref:Uncharacterized protein n=1 Tax=Leptospira borgpetersenii serovar Pomona str. 200901868 TaxID=1192866 RepID=M6WGU7_LEPBO|nr:hypothetical protein LEP1GSC133_5120 [Leptospira borgpetersenii serovar Pomona str. 200901868]